MPVQMWTYPCCSQGEQISGGSPTCPDCGKPGLYDGWHYTMDEAKAVYQNRYGLKPTGPHRRLADELFQQTSVSCLECAGRGLLDAEGGSRCVQCMVCHGTGKIWMLTQEEFEARRNQVLKAFPQAGVEEMVDEVSGRIIHDLESSKMIDLDPRELEGGARDDQSDLS